MRDYRNISVRLIFIVNTFSEFQSFSVKCNRSVVLSGPPVSSTSKTDRHDITEILLKVALNT